MEKLKTNKRFFIVLGFALLLLAGAVFMDLKLGKAKTEPEEPGAELSPTEAPVSAVMAGINGYFNEFRDERSRVRAQEIDYLRSVINSENTDADALEDARGRLFELVSNMEKEFTIESRIRGKGFTDAAASVKDGSASVVIDGASLSDEEVARILDIIIAETGLPASAVSISPGA
ncbi:MAG: SpoIIIAH-like family protein [Clostridia bacterium]|nr:SpoIIIAH-like family protein [Clostridia bacterium]